MCTIEDKDQLEYVSDFNFIGTKLILDNDI